jgi:hypothetical protein
MVVKYTVCSSMSSIASGGRTSITDHLQAKKQKNPLLAKPHLGCMINYFRKLEPSNAEYDLADYEGTYAYNTVLYNNSFRSMDCTTSLQTIHFPVQEQSVNQSLPTFMLLGLLKD